MKKAILIIILFLQTFNNISAQINLVPNGDFEIYSALPQHPAQSNLAVGWNNVNGHYYPFGGNPYGSPDYLNALGSSFLLSGFGAITPYSGNGQMGIETYDITYSTFREYISTKLSKTMKSGNYYTISFYLSNGTGGNTFQYEYGTNNFGICFSANPLYQATHEAIPVTPQIEIDSIIYFYNFWHHFSFNFIADSSYKYITIGNFKDDSNTSVYNYGSIYSIAAYYFIDKIELFPFLAITGDSIICKGNTATLKMYGDSIVNWKDSLNPVTLLATDSIITVAPTTTTTYMAYSSLDTAYFTVHVVSPPIVNLGNDTSLCQGQTLILNATTPYATYLWQDSTTNATYNITQAGTYWVKVTNNNNCSASDTIHITYNQNPIINFGSDTTLCFGQTLLLNATNIGSTYLWQDNSTDSIYNVSQPGIYWVTVTNTNNCSTYDTINIYYNNCDTSQTIIPGIYIPNSFTPNGNGLNDIFKVITLYEFSEFKLLIFDRWGEQLFESTDINKGWDGTYKGKPVPLGVYVYLLDYTINETNFEKKISGRVTVIR